MKLLILGMGKVGQALALMMVESSHHVIGTTTSPNKVPALAKIATDIHVLRGEETDKVAKAAADCDAIVVTVAPDVRKARDLAEREIAYHETLVKSCVSAAKACPRVIFLSSFSVYGDGGTGSEPIAEDAPTANYQEPSSRYYQMGEKVVLASDKGCVLRLPDFYGAPGDISFADRVKLGHEIMGGKVPFAANAPLYCIHYLDVAQAIQHVVLKSLYGIYNVCDNDTIPASNKEVFDTICEREGLPKLTFLGQIKTPNRKISAQKIYDSGFRLIHSDVNHPLAH